MGTSESSGRLDGNMTIYEDEDDQEDEGEDDDVVCHDDDDEDDGEDGESRFYNPDQDPEKRRKVRASFRNLQRELDGESPSTDAQAYAYHPR